MLLVWDLGQPAVFMRLFESNPLNRFAAVGGPIPRANARQQRAAALVP
jgi:hypothetical protein